MLTTKKARKVLTKAEQKHLTATGVNSMAAFLRNREQHHKWMAEGMDEPCHECRIIALKLGVED